MPKETMRLLKLRDRYQSQCSEPWLVAATASPGSTQNAIRQLWNRLNVHRLFVANREDDLLQPYAVDMNIATIRVMLDAKTVALLEPLEADQFQETDALKRQGFLPPTEHLTAGMIEEEHNGRALQYLARTLGVMMPLDVSLMYDECICCWIY